MARPHLSPSQLTQFLNCGVAWQRRYIAGERTPSNGYLVRGTALDLACTTHYRDLARGLPGLDEDEFVECALSEHSARVEEGDVVLEVPEKQSRQMLALAAGGYWREIARKLRPRSYADVQRKYVVDCGEFDVLGYVDLVTDTGVVVDHKLKGRPPSPADLSQDLQLSTYSWLTGARTLALAVAQPNGQAGIYWTERDEEDGERVKRLYLRAWEAMQAGVVMPAAPGSWNCSERWCPHFRSCEFGGGK